MASSPSSSHPDVHEHDGGQRLLGDPVDEVGDLAARNGLPVHGLMAEQASLEDVFMDLTQDSLEYQGTHDDQGAHDYRGTHDGN